MQMMFPTKIANLLARCHPVRKADVDKAAFFSHFCSNKLTSSAEHFNLIISRGRGMVFNNHLPPEKRPLPLLGFRSHWDGCARAPLGIDACWQAYLLPLSSSEWKPPQGVLRLLRRFPCDLGADLWLGGLENFSELDPPLRCHPFTRKLTTPGLTFC